LAAALALVALVLFAAAVALVLRMRAPSTPATGALRPPQTTGTLEAPNERDPGARRSATREQMPPPVRIVIPAIDVSARVVPLGLNPDRTLEVPRNFAETGWFTEGPEPGERGAAVIAGHVSSRSGPAVFFRLRALRTGEVIRIRLKNGTTVRYVVDSMLTVPKSRFPTQLVYAKTERPTLRLITCSGEIDRSTGEHPDNLIVFASIVERGENPL
jgi:LPXTG-site transpeptidase (sortase) family protein